MKQKPISSRPRRRSRHGYVLFLVLIVLIVASASLVTLASGSHAIVLDSVDRQEALQRRWALRSAERSLLKGASKAMAQRDESLPDDSPQEVRMSPITDLILLGDVELHIVLADEEAKLNLNTIYHRKGIRNVETSMRKLLPAVAAGGLQVMPMIEPLHEQRQNGGTSAAQEDDENTEESEQSEWIPPAFDSFGQLFDYSRLGIESLPIVTTGITCWGSGRLNMQRASDDAILAACSTVVPDGLARRILKAYRESTVHSTRNVLRNEVSNESDRDELSQIIGDGSTSYSMWLTTSGRRGKQQKFIALVPDFEGTARTIEFDF